MNKSISIIFLIFVLIAQIKADGEVFEDQNNQKALKGYYKCISRCEYKQSNKDFSSSRSCEDLCAPLKNINKDDSLQDIFQGGQQSQEMKEQLQKRLEELKERQAKDFEQARQRHQNRGTRLLQDIPSLDDLENQKGNLRNGGKGGLKPSVDHAQIQNCRNSIRSILKDCINGERSSIYDTDCIAEKVQKTEAECLDRACQMIQHLKIDINVEVC
ncbi:hypothetical protein PPERSA_00431 [Pseudocohnilembus persalinus]|uniref:Uncharacterized protein n=1 Tax=Pseudocohnilembus persalinus TaxID=266149 RepID=A0A0V0Q9L2_PSEPJ|nr:hypothetical protein PPERSA_00431 [Pseudocohnilembus persalinus]|eukprot:KRW98842.1 hypothetical protein PPERSA_00431 [Pseudocohnilembus persalinus]